MKVRKISLAVFIILFIFSLLPQSVQANGLVPCGTERDPETGKILNPCTFCDFFILFNNIVKFVFEVIPFIAAAFLIVAGIMLYFAGAKPSLLMQARSIITHVVVGMAIILSAWVIVNAIFSQFGVVNIEGFKWYEIECPT